MPRLVKAFSGLDAPLTGLKIALAYLIVEFRLLGPVECVLAGEPLTLGRPQERCLLAVLLLDLGRVVSVDRLVELLWDGDPPERARSIVHTHVSRLRSRLRRADADRYGVRLLTRGQGYLMEAPEECVDAYRFRRLVERAGQTADPARRAAVLRQALALWRGPALADVATERIREQACIGLDEQRVVALEDRAEADLAVGNHRELVTELTDLVARYPLRERLVGQLMLAMYRSGQQAGALSVYRETRRRLVDELGIEPGAQLRRLEHAVLTQDPALDVPLAFREPQTAAVPPGVASTTVDSAAIDWRGPRSHLSTIVGRHAESSRLAALLTDHRLVTVVGVGGVGKTTLVLHTLETAGAVPKRGVTIAALASLRTEDEVIVSIGDLLGIGGATVAETMAGIERFLREQPQLLVLDNCEHLAAVCARLIRTLLAACPRLMVVATSREPLGLPEETVWRLEPLEVPPQDAAARADVPAVALFLRRGAEALPGFAPDHAELAAVGRICRRVDGLPLALELAASRLRTLPVGELAEHLEQGFGLLATGADRGDPLAATLDWSYRLLSNAEQRLLARLSIFRGGFVAAAAEQVCAQPPLSRESVLATLAGLIDRCMVQPYDVDGVRRYRLLEVVREYAAARLDELGERQEVAHAHLDYQLDLVRAVAARPLFDEQVRGWLTLRADRDNLRAAADDGYATGRAADAVELTMLLFDFWALQETHFVELERWWDRAVPYLADCPPQLRCLAQLNGAYLRTIRDDHVGALALIRPALPDLRVHHPASYMEARIAEVRAMTRLLDPAALPGAVAVHADLGTASDAYYRLHAVTMLAEAQITWGRYREAAELCAGHDPAAPDTGPHNTARFLSTVCLAELGCGAYDRASAAESRLRVQLGRPGNFLHLSTSRQAMAVQALVTLPPGQAAAVIADIVRELVERYPPTMSRAYGFLILLSEARRRAGQLDQALSDVGRGLSAGLAHQDYSQLMPGVLTVALLAAAMDQRATSHTLSSRWELLRQRLGLPAPLGFAEPVAALGLDPAPSHSPQRYDRWDVRDLRDLVVQAYEWCVRHRGAFANEGSPAAAFQRSASTNP